MYKSLKNFVWICLEDTWLIKRGYPVYLECAFVIRELFRCFRDDMPVYSFVLCKKKMLSLTFDDGQGYTEEILKKLEQHQVRATFFLKGVWVEENQRLCRKILDAGHEIGNHGYSHSDMTKLSDAEIRREISRTQHLVEKVSGEKCVLFRPPFGACNEGIVRLAGEEGGLKVVKWSINSLDWTGIPVEAICDNVLGDKMLKRGGIVLLHTFRHTTVEALDLLIPALKEKGYQLVRVTDLFCKG